MIHRGMKILFALAGVAVLALGAALTLYLDHFSGPLSRGLGDAWGVPVTFAGPLGWAWERGPVLQASRVSLKTTTTAVHIDSLSAAVDPGTLFSGDLQVQALVLSGMTVDLDPGRDGPFPALPAGWTSPPFERIEIRDLQLARGGRPLLHLDHIVIHRTEPTSGLALAVQINGAISGQALARLDGVWLRLSQLRVTTPAGTITGSTGIALGSDPIKLRGRFAAQQLHFDPPTATSPVSRLIPRASLDVSLLEGIDADFQFGIQRLTLGKLRLHEISVPLSLRRGRLRLEGRSRLAGGEMELNAEVFAGNQDWRSRVRFKGLDAGALARSLDLESGLHGGRLQGSAQLQAHGTHSEALLRSLQGRVMLGLDGAGIEAGAARLAAADVPTGIARMLTGGGAGTAQLHCAVARFEVRNGILKAAQSIGAQTEVTNVLGSGEISLADERLDLILRPWPREGLGLSATAITGAVALRGPLSQPRIELTREAIWRGGLSAGAALATGGLSLLAQGLLERARGDDPCARALGLNKRRIRQARTDNEVGDARN